jgi:hypothetical protein
LIYDFEPRSSRKNYLPVFLRYDTDCTENSMHNTILPSCCIATIVGYTYKCTEVSCWDMVRCHDILVHTKKIQKDWLRHSGVDNGGFTKTQHDDLSFYFFFQNKKSWQNQTLQYMGGTVNHISRFGGGGRVAYSLLEHHSLNWCLEL